MKILFHQRTNQIDKNDVLEIRKPSIREELIQTRRALEIAYSGFDNVTDPDLIDCYIYEVNAVMKRYKYLLEHIAEEKLLPEEEISDMSKTAQAKPPAPKVKHKIPGLQQGP